jgi:hypothetical protein
MKTIWLVLALAAAPLWGQEGAVVHKIVPLKYVDAQAAQMLIRNVPGVSLTADRELKVIALTGKAPSVEMAEAALKQLDVPGAAPKDIDLTVYFIVGRDDAATGGAIPADLQSTVATLKQTFPFKNYELLDALSLRARSGMEGRTGGSTSGQISGGRLTSFSVRSVSMDAGGSMVRIDGLAASVRQLQNIGQGNAQYVDVSGVKTEVVDVKEGQKLVIGRSSLEGPGRALFLVLIARMAQ